MKAFKFYMKTKNRFLPPMGILALILVSTAQCINTIKTFNTVTFLKHSSKLDISYNVAYNDWRRNPETDLPRCHSSLEFNIFNSGQETSDAHLTVILDESSIVRDIAKLKQDLNTVTGAYVLSEYEDFGVSYDLKTFLAAKTGQTYIYSYSTNQWSVDFPRYNPINSPTICNLYITPNNPTVVETETEHGGFPNWLTLLEWVAWNIAIPGYRNDWDIHDGMMDYWQLPTETLTLGTGDCEDFAILLCSLYRANGYNQDSAFVVGGYPRLGEGPGHCWVRIYTEYLGIGTWINVDPQDPTAIIGGLIDFALFEAAYQFNDVYFERLK